MTNIILIIFSLFTLYKQQVEINNRIRIYIFKSGIHLLFLLIAGGGKKVTRVEVTMDGGETWLVCDLDHQEKPNKYGKYWCWCFWSLEVEVLDLLSAKEIAVRAWDQTLNTQPEKLIWNVMVIADCCDLVI